MSTPESRVQKHLTALSIVKKRIAEAAIRQRAYFPEIHHPNFGPELASLIVHLESQPNELELLQDLLRQFNESHEQGQPLMLNFWSQFSDPE